MDILGVLSPSTSVVAQAGAADVPVEYVVLPAVACGTAGFFAWKSHPVLGFFLGETIGANAYRLYRGEGDDRARAVCGLATQALACVVSLGWKEHPFYGFCVGYVAGSSLTALVPGSNAHVVVAGLKARK